MTEREFDVVVVGAGLAGCCAAIAAARKGCSVALIERGRNPGVKNMIGGILYTPVLDRMLPDFARSAPLERHIVSRSFGFLTADSHFSFELRSGQFDRPPSYNHSFTVRRTAFDPWLVAQARAAGASVVPSTVVEAILHEDGDPSKPATGVRCGREGGEIRAKVVVLAEGANALLAERNGFRKKTVPNQAMLGVKEILLLDRSTIEDRFAVEGDAGRAFEFFGEPAQGGFGSGFVYTNAESLSVGVAVSLAHLAKRKLSPPDLLDRFKEHPSIRPLIRGAEPAEYCAHLLPISGGRDMPALVRDGVLLAGDAARLANMSHYKEITNLVTASGEAAGEAAAEAVAKGDVSAAGLKGYPDRLESGFVLRDLRKYAGLSDLMESEPELTGRYPRLLVNAFVKHLTVSERPKDAVERDVLREWNREARPGDVRRHFMAVLEATGFAMAPLIKKMAFASAVPGWNRMKAALRALLPRRGGKGAARPS